MTERLSAVKDHITIYIRKENYKLKYFTVPVTAEQEDEVNQHRLGEHHKKWTGVMPEILKRTLNVPRPCFVGKTCKLLLSERCDQPCSSSTSFPEESFH